MSNTSQSPTEPLTPIEVKLVGEDGNAYYILSKVQNALKRAGYPELAGEFLEEATQGDYDHLLRTCMKYVDVI